MVKNNMKIDSLKLQVEFDFCNLICKVTDVERYISEEYQHYYAFANYAQTIEDISNFNRFIGNCVDAFLDDNGYCVVDDEDIDFNDE